MSGVARFDCYPSDFLNGMVGMTADQIALYAVIIFLQYDRGEAILVEGREREIAIRAGMTKSRLAKAVDDLVALGKLQREGGHVFNARTAKELEKIRARIAENRVLGSKGGIATREKYGTKTKENNEPDAATATPNAAATAPAYSPPPLPLPPTSFFASDETSSAKPAVKSTKASRLPEGWRPSPEARQFSIDELGEARARHEFAKFGDYWRAKSGKDATKLDWNLTWRNWVRTAKERGGAAVRDGPSNSQWLSTA